MQQQPAHITAIDTILKIALGPVLLHQGRQVKKNTPRLPEAPGPRHGIFGKGTRPLNLLVLGDSAAAGVGVDDQRNCLACLTAKHLSQKFHVSWTLAARSGMTTADMLQHLSKAVAQNFDVAVVSLGVNDVKAGVAPDLWLARQQALAAMLVERLNVRRIVLSMVPPMEKFPALPWPLSWYLGGLARQMNQGLARWTAGEKHMDLLAFDMPMARDLMASDGFHPGKKLHAVWARQAAELILAHGDQF